MEFYLKVLEITSLYTILVLGAYLMTGLTGLFSLGQGGFENRRLGPGPGAFDSGYRQIRFRRKEMVEAALLRPGARAEVVDPARLVGALPQELGRRSDQAVPRRFRFSLLVCRHPSRSLVGAQRLAS